MSVESSVERGAPTSACPACGYVIEDPSAECPKCVETRKSLARLQEMLRPHLGGRYDILAKAGAGSAGDVYRARDRVLERDVAIKRVRLDHFSESEERERRRERTVHEAKVAAKLKHSHIVTIHDILDMAEVCFIVMEFIDGPTLEQLLRKKKRLSLDETIELLAPAAEALDYAHASSVVHRDVKPSNIMIEGSKIDGSREVKVTDFGIAKSEASKDLTAAGDILGSPNYMSPEQAAGKNEVTAASDLFSLASIAYECLTGRRAFRAASAMKTLMAIIQKDPPPIDSEGLGLDPDIEDVFARGLAKDPSKRFYSGGEFIEALLSLPHREAVPQRGEERPDEPAEAAPLVEEAPAAAVPVEEPAPAASIEGERRPHPLVITRREPGAPSQFDPRLQGDLNEAEVAVVSREIYRTRHSGILHFTHEEIQKRIYFKKGNIVFANSDLDTDRLGECLVRSKRLERKDLERVSEAMQRSGARFGKTLVELQLLGQEELDEAVRGQIEAIVYSVFRWDTGSYRFELLAQPVEEDIVLNLSTENLILGGVRQISSMDRIQSSLGELDRVLRQSENALLLFERMILTTSEGFVLSRVDGATSVAEITSMSPLGDEETLRCIYALVTAGVLELLGGTTINNSKAPESDQEASIDLPGSSVVAPAEDQQPLVVDSVEATGLEEDGRDEEVPTIEGEIDTLDERRENLEAEALYQAEASDRPTAPETGPDSSAVAGPPEVPDPSSSAGGDGEPVPPDESGPKPLPTLEGISETTAAGVEETGPANEELDFAGLDQASEAPEPESSSPTTATVPSSAPAKAQATTPGLSGDHLYLRARQYFERSEYFEAKDCLRQALELSPDVPSFHKLLAMCLAKDPDGLEEAERHYSEALKGDEGDIECLMRLAEVYEALDQPARAMEIYQRTLEHDPQNEVAQEKIKQAPKKKRGLRALARLMTGRSKP